MQQSSLINQYVPHLAMTCFGCSQVFVRCVDGTTLTVEARSLLPKAAPVGDCLLRVLPFALVHALLSPMHGISWCISCCVQSCRVR